MQIQNFLCVWFFFRPSANLKIGGVVTNFHFPEKQQFHETSEGSSHKKLKEIFFYYLPSDVLEFKMSPSSITFVSEKRGRDDWLI